MKLRAMSAAILAMLTLSGCRHGVLSGGKGMSSFRVVEPPPDRTMPAASAEQAEPSNRAQYRDASVQEKSIVLPVYPVRALAAKAGAAQVGVRIVVGVDGAVTDIRPSLMALTIAPAGFAADFEGAVRDAVRQWKFHPARVEHTETVTTDGFTYQRVTSTELIEAEFDLSFTFTPSGKVEAK